MKQMTHSPKGFPRQFYLANAMEVFERIAWYGFFTLSSLYMTSAPANGGLGLSDGQRGVLQGLIPFFVYILPTFTGALGDHIGYRKMFFAAFIILTPSYYLLGIVDGFWAFLGVYLLVALGAAIFKPLVVATVARSATDANRGLAFGVFFLMVNVGGFLGPIAAGYARAISWDMVFILASGAIAVNFVILPFLERDGDKQIDASAGAAALADVQHVLGNTRFALVVAPVLIALLVAGGGWISYTAFTIFAGAWIILNLVWDKTLSAQPDAPWHRQRMRIGNGPFLTYLIVLSIFWAAYNQIFVTLPLYIRDYIDSSDLVSLASALGPGFVEFISPVNIPVLVGTLQQLSTSALSNAGVNDTQTTMLLLAELQVRPPAEIIAGDFARLSQDPSLAHQIATDWAKRYRQVSPEYIIAVDFLSIVLFQYFISRFAQSRPPFSILVTGALLIGAAYVIGGFAHVVPFAGLLVAFSVMIFAFGEMFASPKSQEFVATIAPHEQSAMFMGYYFVSLALGFLFAGLLSGWAYEFFTQTLGNPTLMWLFFAALACSSAVALYVFKITVAPKIRAAGE